MTQPGDPGQQWPPQNPHQPAATPKWGPPAQSDADADADSDETTTFQRPAQSPPGYQPPPQTPSYQPPVQPPSYQPPAQTPSYQTPSYQPPQQTPSYQQPSYQPPAQTPSYQTPSYQPPQQTPSYQQPSYQQPSYQQPSYQQPAAQPQYGGGGGYSQTPQQGYGQPSFQPDPPAKSRRGLFAAGGVVILIIAAVAVVLVVKPAFLGFSKVFDSSAVATTIQNQSSGQYTNVSCPANEKVKKGATFQCTAGNGTKITVTVTDEGSAKYTWAPS